MNPETVAAMARLVQLMEQDETMTAEAMHLYGDWIEHLQDHLNDLQLEDL